MKKFITPVLLIAIMICAMALPGHVQAGQEVKVKIDGQYVNFPDQQPYIDSANRTMVPVRAPMEQMGCTVSWNDVKRQATITKGSTTAVFTIDSKTYTVNGQNKTMDTKAVIVNSRTAFPIRFAAEAMGATVTWDASTYTVLISTAEVKIVDLGRSSDAAKTDDIQVGNYIIHVSNIGIDDPSFWFGISDNTYPQKDIRVVCSSNPEWNECTLLCWDAKYRTYPQDVWTNSFKFYKDGYSPVQPKSGDRVTFDIFGKLNGQETKILILTKTLP